MPANGSDMKPVMVKFCILLVFAITLYCPSMSHAVNLNSVSVKADTGQQAAFDRNLNRWRNLTDSQKEYYRKLYKRYCSLSADKRDFLKKQMVTFYKLPANVQRLIMNNYKRLKRLPENDRRSFFSLVKKYQRLPDSKKSLVRKAFRKVRTLPKDRQLKLFHLLLKENQKPNPALRKVIKDFLEHEGLSSRNRP